MNTEKNSTVTTYVEERLTPAVTAHDVQLQQFGYQPELKRSFGKLEMIGFSFSIVNSWAALACILTVGIVSGGPPVVLWGWLGVSFMALFVAHAFAEMCSAYPIAGGQYSWVAILSPPRYRRPLSYITGWFMNAGSVGVCAFNNLLFANFVLGIANLNFPSYTIQRWHNVLIGYGLAINSAVYNIYIHGQLHRIYSWNLIWNILTFLVTAVTILACNDHKQSAEFVFLEFQDETGFGSPGMAIMIGILQSVIAMACYDAPAKMVEELKEPTKDAPKAIVMSVWLGAITGFVYLVSCYFCIGDLQTTANTPTQVPLIQIFYDSTHSRTGTTVLIVMMLVGFAASAVAGMTESSRGLWALARDNGLPGSSVFKKVDKNAIPTNAILLSLVVQVALNSMYFTSPQAFNTILSLGSFGFYLSYAMPLAVRLWAYFSGYVKVIPGPYSLGEYSPWVYGVGLGFIIFGGIDLCFPQVAPVNYETMSYCSAAAGVFALISLVTWFTTGRKHFTGPKIDGIHRTSAEHSDVPTQGRNATVAYDVKYSSKAQ